MIDYTVIIQAVITLIGVVITAVIVPAIKQRTTENQQEQINRWVSVAVQAAEQTITGDGKGIERKAYVLRWLAANKITVDETKLDALIESAVYKLKNGVL